MEATEIIIPEVLVLLSVTPAEVHRKCHADARCMATAVAHQTGLVPAKQVSARFSDSPTALRRNLARHSWRMTRRIYRLNFRLACDAVLRRSRGQR